AVRAAHEHLTHPGAVRHLTAELDIEAETGAQLVLIRMRHRLQPFPALSIGTEKIEIRNCVAAMKSASFRGAVADREPGIHDAGPLEYGFRARRPSRCTPACACRVAHLRCATAPRTDRIGGCRCS